MRYQVPQFVDIQDRIIGPLTLKQFLFYMAAGMLLVPVYFLSDLGLFLSVAIPTVGVAAAFAHIHWRGQTFASLLSHGLRYFTGERMYLWRREAGAGSVHIAGSEYEEFTEAVPITTSALDAVVQTLNTQGNIIAQDAADPLLEEEGAK
ncbi:MAG: PrgI family protein [bacterium]